MLYRGVGCGFFLDIKEVRVRSWFIYYKVVVEFLLCVKLF